MKEKIARWGLLFAEYLKRDWKKTILWILGVGLFSAAYVPAFVEISKGEGLLGMFEVMQNPAMISMVGPTPVEVGSAYTIGAMYAHTMTLFCGLFAMTVSILHVVDHTREEEEAGLTELVRSFQIGRQANSLAVTVQTLLINILLAVFIGVVMISFRVEAIPAEGSFLFGASIGLAGMIGAAIALFMAQIMPTSSGAKGASLGIMGLLYIIRGVTDVSNVKLSMLNPMGWTYLTNPFTENNWLPLVFGLVFCFALVMTAFTLEGARDMGAGYLPEREGRSNAKKSLLSVSGLFMKINKGIILGWLLAFVLMGIAYGSIYGDMHAFIESNELVSQMFTHAGVTLEESFTGTIMMVMIALVAILPIAVVNRLYAAESRMFLSQLYATKVTRSRFYWTSVGLAILAGIVGIFAAAGGLGATAIAVTDGNGPMQLLDFFAAGFNFLPAVLFFIGLSALVLGWFPRLGKAVYLYLGYSFLLNYIKGIVELPEWILKTAVQSWIPRMPIEAFDVVAFTVITTISIVLIIAGHIGYTRRDMDEKA
ncbi:MAG: tetronasin resistance protein [Clostridia bacterium]|nr:tetronasin resistance protein [Clostridia bacterium]